MATTTKTTRRATKITTKPYTPAALTRVYDKASGVCLGYLAPSRDGKDWYQVTCDEYGAWHCTCRATIENCCHVKAAKELCAIRVEQGRPACRAASLPVVEAPVEAKKDEVTIIEQPTISDDTMRAIVAAAHEAVEVQPAAIVDGKAEHRAAEARKAVEEEAAARRRSEAARREAAPLNGNRGFSLLRTA